MRNELALSITLGDPHLLVLDDDHRFTVLNAGRGFGKTQLILAKMFKHLQRKYTDKYGRRLKHKIWYIAPTYKQGEMIFWERLKDFFAPLIKKKNEQKRSITLKGGAEIRIVGSEQSDNLRGPYLTLAIFDEFAFHKPNYWSRVIRPMLSRVRPLGEAGFYSTPDGHNEFYTLFQRGDNPEAPDWTSFHFTSLEGGFIDDDEIQAAKNDSTYEEWRQEYFGEFIAQAGRVYRSFDRGIHCKDIQHVPGLDIHWFWDFNEVPACHSGLGHIHKNKLFVFDEVCIGSTEQIVEEFFKRYPKDSLVNKDGILPKIYLYGDVSGTRGTSGVTDYMMIEHMLVNAGYPRPELCVTTTNPFEKDRVNSVNVKLRNAAGDIGILINPKTCSKLVNDLEQVKRDETGKIDKKTDRRITHISDGLGYCVYQVWPVDSPSTRVMKAKQGKTMPGGYWVEAS